MGHKYYTGSRGGSWTFGFWQTLIFTWTKNGLDFDHANHNECQWDVSSTTTDHVVYTKVKDTPQEHSWRPFYSEFSYWPLPVKALATDAGCTEPGSQAVMTYQRKTMESLRHQWYQGLTIIVQNQPSLSCHFKWHDSQGRSVQVDHRLRSLVIHHKTTEDCTCLGEGCSMCIRNGGGTKVSLRRQYKRRWRRELYLTIHESEQGISISRAEAITYLKLTWEIFGALHELK